jgi:hypothetical protein
MNLPDILTEITERPLDELAAADLPELDRLFRELAVVKEHARLCETTLQSAMHLRYRECADLLRQRAGKRTGTVRFEDAGFVIVSDLPKKVEYDQPKLKAAVETLRSWGENPDHYVGVEIKVSETKYHAWPPAIRALFEPARTLGTGKPSYKLEPVAANQGGRR